MTKKFTSLFHAAFIFMASMGASNAVAQNRHMANYAMNERAALYPMHKNSMAAFFPSSLSGYYFEGFENTFPPAGWQVIDVMDPVNSWTSSTVADLPAAFEGNQSAHCKYAYPGPDGEDWLISPKFTVSAGDSLSFFFKLEYFGYFPDSTFILISTTDSALSSFNTVLDYYAEGFNYPGDATNWYYKTYSLNAYAGQDIYIAFKNVNTLGDGIFIDNVELGTRPAAQAAVLSIGIDDFYPAGVSNPKATIKNKGSMAQTFNVAMNITGGYTSVKSVTLPPLSSTQIAFDPWTAAIGSYTVNVQTLLTGDVNPADDTLSVSTKVLEPFVNYDWSTHDPLIVPTVGGAVVSVCSNSNSRYFLAGGNSNAGNSIVPDAYEYDLSFATWAPINSMTSAVWLSASAAGNGKMIVTGGESPATVITTTQIYDYTSGSWSTGTPMPVGVANMAFGTYKDSLLYVIGGRKSNGTYTNAVQIYNIYTDTWTTGTVKPGDAVAGLRGGICGNKIVITGGYSAVAASAVNTTYVGVIDAVNPSQITWTQEANFPLDMIRFPGAGISPDVNSGLVVFTGGSYTNTFSDVTDKTFAFDVNSNSWKLGPDKPTPSHYFYMTPVLQNDSIYLAALGGGDGSFQIDKNEWLNLGYYQFPTGIIENSFITELTLFPNPADEVTTLSIHLKNSAHVKVKITDVMGNTVINVCDKNFNAGGNDIGVKLKDLARGLYFCVVSINGNLTTKKLLKN